MTNENKQLSVEDLKKWVEFVSFETVKGKEPTEKEIKQLERLAKREVTLADASSIAQYLVRLETQAEIRQLNAMVDATMFILRDKLDVTPEDINKALDERDQYIKELEEEEEQDKAQEENSKEEDKDSKGDKSNKVVSIDKEGK